MPILSGHDAALGVSSDRNLLNRGPALQKLIRPIRQLSGLTSISRQDAKSLGFPLRISKLKFGKPSPKIEHDINTLIEINTQAES